MICSMIRSEVSIFQSTKVSFITALHVSTSEFVSFSKTRMILVLSTVRIWSIAIIPFLPLCFTETLVGYFFRFVVIGARTIVFKYLFISLGETITHGLVFLFHSQWLGQDLQERLSIDLNPFF